MTSAIDLLTSPHPCKNHLLPRPRHQLNVMVRPVVVWPGREGGKSGQGCTSCTRRRSCTKSPLPPTVEQNTTRSNTSLPPPQKMDLEQYIRMKSSQGKKQKLHRSRSCWKGSPLLLETKLIMKRRNCWPGSPPAALQARPPSLLETSFRVWSCLCTGD